MGATPVLDAAQRRFVAEGRTATLATLSAEGRPRLVPICYVIGDGDDARGRPVIYSPLDEKPKRVDDVHQLARVRDLLVLPEVTLLVDRWDEDWSKLAWVRLYGAGEILEPQPHERDEHTAAVAALKEKYRQYREQALDERPLIRMTIERALAWGTIEGTR